MTMSVNYGKTKVGEVTQFNPETNEIVVKFKKNNAAKLVQHFIMQTDLVSMSIKCIPAAPSSKDIKSTEVTHK